MSKKEKELLVLKNIYYDNKITIISSEQPDFIIDGINEKFGVEVTDYYYNESSARLKNKPEYFESIINSDDSSVLTKKDKDFITKLAIYVKDSKDDKYKLLSTVVGLKYNDKYEYNDIPSYEDVEKQIIDIINKKNQKALNYKKLDYYELFIQDKENYFAINKQCLSKLKNSKLILDNIIKSKFKRVYIFSKNLLCIVGVKPTENMIKYNIFESNKDLVSIGR